MARKKKNAGLLDTIQERFESAQSYYSSEYKRGEEDAKFLYGDQWSEEDRKARAGRPCLVENRLPAFKHQVLNSIKQANLAIKVSPVDDKADPETAQILQGICRNIEVQSNADVAYDTAASSAIDTGYGYIRIIVDYADYESFDEEIRIERVLNPQSVLLDPCHLSLDGSDSEYAFIFDEMSHEAFKDAYPDASPVSFDKKDMNPFVTDEKVIVAEYFYKHYEDKKLYQLADGSIVWEGEFAEGMDVVNTRTSRKCTIKWCKTNGQEILEETDWRGKYIPIVLVAGEEAWVEGKRRLYSLIHQGKDPQRMLNYWNSAETELLALQPKAPYIGAVGSFESRAAQWQNANNGNPAYLEYDAVFITDPNSGQAALAPPPQREQPPSGSPAMMQRQVMAAGAIKAALGMFDPTLGEHGNEISGTAIKQRQLQGDKANFHFIDNLAMGIRQVGKIIVDLIPKIYTDPQMMRIIGIDETVQVVPVNQPYVKAEGGLLPYDPIRMRGARPDGIYDLNVGKYDVVVEVGANYATKRQELVDSILQLAQAKPEILNVAGDILIKNLDIPDTDELVKRIRSVMPPEVLGDDPQAMKLQMAAQENQALKEQLVSMQIQLDEKAKNQAFDNDLKLKQLQSQNIQFEVTARQKDKELEIKAIEAAAKVQKEAPLPPEILGEVAGVLDELLVTTAENKMALEAIISAKENEATVLPPQQ
jgi:hypothetical protein